MRRVVAGVVLAGLAGLAGLGNPAEAPVRPVEAEVCCASTVTQSEFLAEMFPGLGEAGAW